MGAKTNKGDLNDLLMGYDDLFAWTSQDLGRTSFVTHPIFTDNAPPIKQRYYRTSPKEREFLEKEINRMLREGLIQPSYGPWASSVMLVKQHDKIRFCIDYHRLNAVTKKDMVTGRSR
ncbi:2589_t:CDS:2 [Racocetra fulgida]|uniref:2589_t:CDS:1 n=1 Tax=Racocetra fulgida TaxID=60492 RepID=A0A9N8WIK1_9GLOM|nr:2589_t:CDS:2 [Racocetra fulgida]